MKPFVLLSLGCTFYLWSCATASIAPSESQLSALPTSENTVTPTMQPTVKNTPNSEPSQPLEKPDNPCPDFHLTPQNLDLPVEKISGAPTELNAMCSSPSTGDLYLLTDTEVLLFDINTQQAQKVFENSPDFKKLVICAVDKQENIYLGDDGTDQLFQYHNTNKTWTKLEQNIEGVGRLGIFLGNTSLQISPRQELFFNDTSELGIFYYNQALQPKLFELSYKDIRLEKFNTEFYHKQFSERNLNSIENTMITNPSAIAFGPEHLFITTPSGWNEMFKINLNSGEISTLPSVEQRGKEAFTEMSNYSLSRSLFLNYSSRYKVLFQTMIGVEIPTWTSPETGCWQGLSTQIKPAGLAEGGDGHLYLIDAKTQGLNRIQLSPEIFASDTPQNG